jgi:hypothetical protein
MALTTQPPAARFTKYLGHTAAVLLHGEEHASSTYKKGAFLQDDGSGLIGESVSPIDGSGVTKRAFGIASRDATGVTSADVPFVFIGTALAVIEGTLSDLSAGTHTLAAADKWQTYSLTKGTSAWYLNANVLAANGAFLIDSINGFKKDIGVVDCRVLFILTAAARGGLVASSGAL